MIIKIHLFKTPLLLCNVSVASRSKLFNQLLILLIPLILISCRERVVPPPDKPPYIPPIVLTAEDVGVTDAFIRLKFLDTSNVQAKTFILMRDGKALMTNTIIANDTLLFDEGLLPKRTYKYKSYRLTNNTIVDSSAELPITTMDSTSHNFNFEVFYLGDGASSVLYDVAIINDTCVWAVGEIYKKDSLGNWDNEPYGAARWDGKKWHLMKVSYRDFGNTTIWPGKLKAVYGFSPDNIYVASSANLLKWNGTSWQEKAFFMNDISWNGRVNKIWGTSENNLYLVGDNGAIYFYNGTSWRRLESGTDVTLTDVWGSPDGSVVWACGWNWQGGSVLLARRDENWIKLWDRTAPNFPYSYYGKISTLWTSGKKEYIVISSGRINRHSILNQNNVFEESFTLGNFAYCIRGNSKNNITIVGANSMIWHFNGYSWYQYTQFLNSDDRLNSVSLKNNLVVAVGLRYGSAFDKYGLIIIGRR